MNVSVRKILIFAFLAFYLSCESSAAAIEAEKAAVGAEEDAIESDETAESQVEAETTVAAVEDCTTDITFKCGILQCPNGSFCVIKETPSDDQKKITKTTQCRDRDGTVLDENITTEDVPDDEIPFTVVKQKTVNEGKNGNAFFGSSYTGSFKHGNLGSFAPGTWGLFKPGRIGSVLHGRVDGKNPEENEENAIDIDLDDDDVGNVGFLTYFDKVLDSTSDLMHNIFKQFPC